jgi:hypothetical protein
MSRTDTEVISRTATSLVVAYHAKNQDAANQLFAVHARHLSRDGWAPHSQTWAVASPGLGRMLAVGLLAFAARPGILTVMYSKAASARPVAAAPPVSDVPDQIRKLGGLRDAGLITPEEFEGKKAELLARM